MISNETLFHRNPATGEKQPIGLGWLDDSMQLVGPTEKDKNYIADTCGDATSPKCEQELQSQVDAYEASKLALIEKVCSGVFDGNGSFDGVSNNYDGNGTVMVAQQAAHKRQERLTKNKEAAKQCRLKKKEYIKCLETRVEVLENQNKALIHELKTLKDMYCGNKN